MLNTSIKQIRKKKTTCKMVTQNTSHSFGRVKESRSTISKTIFPTNLTLNNINENKYNDDNDNNNTKNHENDETNFSSFSKRYAGMSDIA